MWPGTLCIPADSTFWVYIAGPTGKVEVGVCIASSGFGSCRDPMVSFVGSEGLLMG